MNFSNVFFDESSRWAWALLLMLPVIWWRWYARTRPVISLSTVQWLGEVRPTFRQRARILIPILRSVTVVMLVLCLARPQKGDEQTRVFAEGIAIQMVVDVSGSMEAIDFELEGKPVNRLQAIKHVSREFLKGGASDLAGRPDDMVGLVIFGTYADSLTPLTLDHDMVLKSLDETSSYGSVERQKKLLTMQQDIGRIQRSNPSRARAMEQEFQMLAEEGGTAIGDAVALGVERLRGLERDQKGRNLTANQKIKSKIIILLTDGAQTHGELSPLEGAELAAKVGIKIYPIAVGTRGRFVLPVVDRMGNVQYQEPGDYRNFRIDEPTLQQMAEVTGGKYFHAQNTESLRQVYDIIDKLEKTRTEERRFKQSREMATEFTQLGSVNVPPLLLFVLISLALEVLLAHTWLRSVP